MKISKKNINNTLKIANSTGKTQKLKSGIKGMYLTCRPSGTCSWTLQYRYDNKQITFSFAPLSTTNMADAKLMAHEYKLQIEAGRNPKAERDKQIAEELAVQKHGVSFKTHSMTVGDVFEFYVQSKLSGQRSANTLTNVNGRFNKHIKSQGIHEKLFDEMTKSDWLNVISGIKTGVITGRPAPTPARQLLIDLQAATKLAIEHEKVKNDAINSIKAGTIFDKPKKKNRVLNEHERKSVYEWASNGNGYYHHLALIALSFGARTCEIRNSEIDEWDLDGKIWTVPTHNSKTGIEIVRPIPNALIDRIKRLKSEAINAGSNLLLGEYKKQSTVSQSGGQLHAQLGQKKWTLHDLRRTFVTGNGEIGQNIMIAELVAGHVIGGTASHYQHSTLTEQKLELLTQWNEHIANESTK